MGSRSQSFPEVLWTRPGLPLKHNLASTNQRQAAKPDALDVVITEVSYARVIYELKKTLKLVDKNAHCNHHRGTC